jgi:hypothetical protein
MRTARGIGMARLLLRMLELGFLAIILGVVWSEKTQVGLQKLNVATLIESNTALMKSVTALNQAHTEEAQRQAAFQATLEHIDASITQHADQAVNTVEQAGVDASKASPKVVEKHTIIADKDALAAKNKADKTVDMSKKRIQEWRDYYKKLYQYNLSREKNKKQQ